MWCCSILTPAFAQQVQQAPECTDVEENAIMPSWAIFNYGGVTNAFSFLNKTSYSLGESVVGGSVSSSYFSYTGFWSRYLIPPFAPAAKASQGDFLDRIQITWTENQTGPLSANGFKLYRDGIFLVAVDQGTNSFNDFNVIAGRPYKYEVRGVNLYGEGLPGEAIGFQVPNGTVTGWIQTPSGRPVPDALVALTPLQGFSADFGPMAGAFARADAGTAGSLLPAPGGEWTLAFWIKSSSYSTEGAIMSLSPFPLYLRPNPLLDGIEVAQQPFESPSKSASKSASMPQEALLAGEFPLDKQNQWNHVALTVDANGIGRLYLNGELKSIGELPPMPSADELRLGARAPSSGFWQGRLDELRIYHRRLDELDLGEVMMGTASSQTADLKYYWKMDEELGVASFDVMRRNKLFFCGATFNADRPYVRTMGKTNQQGYYRIESASYGTGTTFLAEPMKDFYLYRALKFVGSQEDYATLPDFPLLTAQATLELWVNSAGPDGEQCVLSKQWAGNDFRLMLKPNGLDNDIWFYLNGQEHNFGPLGVGYNHLAFTIDNQTGTVSTVTAYHNSVSRGSHTFFHLSGNWSDPATPWMLGARPSGGGRTDYFSGLIDEIALYTGLLDAPTILNHYLNVRSPQEAGLRVYFNLDEGNGNRLNNSGSLLLTFGTTFGAEWSPFTAKQQTTPHIFTPETRQVTLNPSVTSVDQVDFVDRSTVPVSGFVRYKNTDCFAPNVEILVNGARFTPGIFTDSLGKFVIDFDPGVTATLTPVFEDHQFIPAFWEVTNVVSPIAGILFSDVTTRKIEGVVAGGECKKSIIEAPPGQGQGTVCDVKVRSVDGCFERVFRIDNQEGEFEFNDLPPLEGMTVSVTEHSNPEIKTFFQVLGGYTVDLTKKDTVVDFIYYAPPEVAINSGLTFVSPICSTIVLNQDDLVTLSVSIVERYVPIVDPMDMNTILDDGVCPLDTGVFRIINGLSDETLDTTMSGTILGYKFRVGVPNPSPPFLKTLQIIGTSVPGGRQGSLTKQVVVTGIRNKLNTFTTQLPEVPLLVLRDPPGDGSHSYWEKNNNVCTTIQATLDNTSELGGGVSIDNGPTVKFIAAPIGVGTQIDTETKFGVAIEGSVTLQKVTDSTFQTCLSSTERISTSDGGLIVGKDADVYVGVGINLSVGLADEVTFDAMNCEASVDIIVTVKPLGATAFRYSQFHIINNVIRYLNLIIDNADPQVVDPQTLADYEESIELWESFIEDNADQKKKAPLVRNLSFDSGVAYEYSETVDTSGSETVSNYTTLQGSTRTFIGGSVSDVGVEAELKFTFTNTQGKTTENGTSTGITTGYVLADDDPGDAFSVNIALDTVYKTPVFRTVAGQSSCPWEDSTANREGPNLQLAPGSQFTAINVPANEPAVFQMSLGSLSATNEDWTYGFTAIAASNPYGAVIKLNGQVLNNNTIQYIVPFGTSKLITLTVERGPVEYEYEDIVVALVSECQMARNFALSLPLDNDPKFFSQIKIGVDFIRPCSEVNINVPTQGFVVLTNDPVETGTERRITVSGYNKNEPTFERVRVQYRRSDGDGAWLNIQPQSDVLKDDLGGVFTQFFWETLGLSDGPYEIRAVAVCTGNASDRPGYSEIIRGRIDREPPSIVGVPQPSDGVYHVGDEISFTFNQHVNCDKLIPADQTQLNNVGLYDATTDQLIDISVTCFENKIVIDPTFDNKFYENRILRAELAGIEDLVGNTFNGTKFNKGFWEFYVDRNELAWLTDSLGMTKFEDENRTITANIHNRGGYPVPFKILGAPDWLHVSPNQGTLAANEIRPINFTVDPSLAFGRWSDTIVLQTQTGQNPFFMGGDEPLPVGVRVVCRPPYSPVNLAQYQNTMNMILKVNIEGVFSIDAEDVVAAFIDNQLRGYANVQYVPQVDAWLAYLTVYGDPADMLKPLRLEVWDASECQRYGSVVESFSFQPDNIIGKTENPRVVHTAGLLLREVPLVFGWNWLSFNLAFPDNSLNAALASLSHPQNDLVRSQTAFSQYTGGWFGSLGNLSNTTMYIYRADQPDTLRMQGTAIDPATTPIPVVAGWNWIGYIPSYALPVNAALASLPAQNGDVIKSQFAFAEYLNPTAGWVGNLKYLSPPNGYQIKLAQAGTLTYPPPPAPFAGESVASRGDETDIHHSSFITHHWALAPSAFEHTNTLIGMIRANGANATTSNMELGAFVGNEVRGTAQAIYIEPLDAHLFFLTTYANAPGELLRFKLYDDATASVRDLSETMSFAPNQHQGSIQNPVPFELLTTRAEEDFGTTVGFDVQPNPFATETTLRFNLPKAEEVTLTISDAQGREVVRRPLSAAAGPNVAIWNGRSDTGSWLSSGVYTVRLQTAAGSVVQKVMLQRLP
jgi:hypothetical protein